jgi:hypothetical protein
MAQLGSGLLIMWTAETGQLAANGCAFSGSQTLMNAAGHPSGHESCGSDVIVLL